MISKFYKKPMRRNHYWIFALLLIIVSQGCAIQYVDKETGTHHLFGFGHMKLKVPEASEGIRSVATGVETFGFSTTISPDLNQLTLGYNNYFNLKVFDETLVRFDWPDDNPFHIHVGTIPPWEVNISGEFEKKQSDKGEKSK